MTAQLKYARYCVTNASTIYLLNMQPESGSKLQFSDFIFVYGQLFSLLWYIRMVFTFRYVNERVECFLHLKVSNYVLPKNMRFRHFQYWFFRCFTLSNKIGHIIDILCCYFNTLWIYSIECLCTLKRCLFNWFNIVILIIYATYFFLVIDKKDLRKDFFFHAEHECVLRFREKLWDLAFNTQKFFQQKFCCYFHVEQNRRCHFIV